MKLHKNYTRYIQKRSRSQEAKKLIVKVLSATHKKFINSEVVKYGNLSEFILSKRSETKIIVNQKDILVHQRRAKMSRNKLFWITFCTVVVCFIESGNGLQGVPTWM